MNAERERVAASTSSADSFAADPLERETIARVKRRMIPLLFLCYYAAYLDRVNVGFAALQMNKTLGLTSAAFGLGGGMLPSSLLDFVERSWGTLRLYETPPVGTHPVAETWKEFSRALVPDRRQFADFSGVGGFFDGLDHLIEHVGRDRGLHLHLG